MLSRIKKFAKNIIGAYVLQPYFKLRMKQPMWRRINKKGVTLFKKYSTELSAAQQRIANELKQNGIAVSHVDDLFPASTEASAGKPNEGVLQELQRTAAGLEAIAEVKTSKTFLKYLLGTNPLLDINTILVRLALDSRALAIVNAYNGMFSKFYYMTLNRTLPVGSDAPAEQSQRWHRDPEDKKMAKMFIYLTDVDENAGPFIYIPGSHSEGKWRNLFPQRPPVGYYPPDGEIEKIVPPAAIKKCEARAGTVIFADTAGLHKGGYAISKERVMFTAGYCSNASVLERQYRYPEDIENVRATLTPAQQYAITFPPHRFNSYILKRFRKFFKQNTY